MSVFERGVKQEGQAVEELLEERLAAAVASWDQPRKRCLLAYALSQESKSLDWLSRLGSLTWTLELFRFCKLRAN